MNETKQVRIRQITVNLEIICKFNVSLQLLQQSRVSRVKEKSATHFGACSLGTHDVGNEELAKNFLIISSPLQRKFGKKTMKMLITYEEKG